MTPAQCPNCNNFLEKGRCSLCGYSSIPQWIRLRHVDGISMTFRAGTTKVSRDLFHTFFRNVLTPSGHPVAAYFPSDGSTFFSVFRTEDGWFISRGKEYRNTVIVERKELTVKDLSLNDGDCIQLFSGKERAIVSEFIIQFD